MESTMSIVPYTMNSTIESNEMYMMSLLVATLLSSFVCIVKKYNNKQEEEDVLPFIEYKEIDNQTPQDIDAQAAAMNRQELQDENDLLKMLLFEQTAIPTSTKCNMQDKDLDDLIINTIKSSSNALSVKDILKILFKQHKELDKKMLNSRLYSMKNKNILYIERKEGDKPFWNAH